MLTDGELAGMRATVDDALPDTFDQQRATSEPDESGGVTETWATIATVSGRLSPNPAPIDPEPVIGSRAAAVARWQITLPAGTDVTTRDRFINTTARTFEVTSVAAGRSWELSIIVNCTEIT